MNKTQEYLLEKRLNDKVLNNTKPHIYTSDIMSLFSKDLLLKNEQLEQEMIEERNISKSYADDVINLRLRIAKLEQEKAELMEFVKILERPFYENKSITTEEWFRIKKEMKKHLKNTVRLKDERKS